MIEVDLRNANPTGANLSGANLGGASLSGATLREANFFRADLIGTSLMGTILFMTDATNANLTDANLSFANLGYTTLNYAKLLRTNLSEAQLHETVFSNVGLTEVVGLETCIHLGPSIVDHRTLQTSASLPLSFLRGLGMQEKLIEYLPSLFNRAIQYYSCFISYSTKDQDFADRIYTDLQQNGVRCWFAPHDLPIGGKILDEISEQLPSWICPLQYSGTRCRRRTSHCKLEFDNSEFQQGR